MDGDAASEPVAVVEADADAVVEAEVEADADADVVAGADTDRADSCALSGDSLRTESEGVQAMAEIIIRRSINREVM